MGAMVIVSDGHIIGRHDPDRASDALLPCARSACPPSGTIQQGTSVSPKHTSSTLGEEERWGPTVYGNGMQYRSWGPSNLSKTRLIPDRSQTDTRDPPLFRAGNDDVKLRETVVTADAARTT